MGEGVDDLIRIEGYLFEDSWVSRACLGHSGWRSRRINPTRRWQARAREDNAQQHDQSDMKHALNDGGEVCHGAKKLLANPIREKNLVQLTASLKFLCSPPVEISTGIPSSYRGLFMRGFVKGEKSS
jgi:hypothetical protein